MSVTFRLNGKPVTASDVSPTTTTLDWLRAQGLTGTKEGCAEGDCGACTIAVRTSDRTTPSESSWRSMCACILPIAQLADQDIVTIEGLAKPAARHTLAPELHPAQQAIVDTLGSQCGYCTPGVVMSLFEATYREDIGGQPAQDDQLSGNLCRCTGYRPIRQALERVAGTRPEDSFTEATATAQAPLKAVDLTHGGNRFVRPTNWEAFGAVLAESDDAPCFIQGATDLGLDITKKNATWPLLVDLSALPGLDILHEDEDGWTIGAGVRLSELENWSADRQPLLARMLRYFGSRQIKNRATMGGSLCNASPIGDLAPALLALDAIVTLRRPSGDRTLPLDDFFLDYRKTALFDDEVMLSVFVPRPPVGARQSAHKVSKRRELDISSVAAAFVVATDDSGFVLHARIAYGGMAATPRRALATEAALRNRSWSEHTLEEACRALSRDFTPIDDHRGSAWYRSTVAANLLRSFFTETRADPKPGLPDRPVSTVTGGGTP